MIARSRHLCCLIALAWAAACFAGDKPDVPAIPIAKLDRTDTVDFEREILPMLRDSCLACHNRTRAKADLILETPADMLKGGENGPAIVPGKSAQSLVLQSAAHQANPVMPPKDNKASAADLTGAQLALLRLWIDQGAKGEVHGSQNITWQTPSQNLTPIYAIALTPDGHYATAGRGNTIDLYDVASQRQLDSLTDPALARNGPHGAAHREMVESLAFSPDGRTLASGGFGEVKLWHRTIPTQKFAVAVVASKRTIACSADGKWFAVAIEGWPIELFDAATGRQAGVIAGSTSATRGMAFSPDGTKLAVASADRGLRIADAAKGTLLAQTVMPADIGGLAWANAGKQIAIGGADALVRLWDVPTGAVWNAPKELKGHTAAVTALAATADGHQLFSGGADGTLRIWNVEDGREIRQWSHGPLVTNLAVRPDGKFIAAIGADHITRLWNSQGQKIAEPKGDTAADRELANRDRAQKLATGNVTYSNAAQQRSEAEQKAAQDRLTKATAANTAATKPVADKEAAKTKATEAKVAAQKAFDAAQVAIKAQTDAAASQEKSLKVARDTVATAKDDDELDTDTLKMLEADVATKSKLLDDLKATLKQLSSDAKPKQAVDEADKGIAKADQELAVARLVKSNADTEQRLAGEAATKSTAALVTAREAVARAEAAQKTADASLAAARQTATTATTSAINVAFSKDNHFLATVGGDSRIHLWSADTGLALQTIESHDPAVTDVAFVGDTLLAGAAGQLELWSLGGNWSLTKTLGGDDASPLTDRVAALAFSPDGRWLATGSGEPTRSGQVKLWDAHTGALVRDFPDVHSDAVLSLAFSPDGAQLASGSADRMAKVLDVASGKVLRTLEGHTGHVLGVAWKADGRTLATCSADRSVRFWDTTTGDKKSSAAGFEKEVVAIAFIGITDQAVAASGEGQVRIVNEAGATVKNVPAGGAFLQTGAMSPDGAIFAVGGMHGALVVWRDLAAPPTMNFQALTRGP